MAPVGSFGFSVPGRRGATVPDGADDELGADALGVGVGARGVGLVDHDLGDPVAVAQVEEDELAVVAAAVDPAGEAGGDARIGRAQLAVRVRAVGRGEAGSGVGHGRRIVVDAG